MYSIQSEISFDSAHFLQGYEGKCSNIHGHRWRVIVELGAPSLPQEGPRRGMVADFTDLKAALREQADRLDHALLFEAGSLRPQTLEALRAEDFRLVELDFRPTAENLARYFYDAMRAKGHPVLRATVYETPANCASYWEGNGI